MHTSFGMGAVIILKCTLFLLYLMEVASEGFGTGCLPDAIAALHSLLKNVGLNVIFIYLNGI